MLGGGSGGGFGGPPVVEPPVVEPPPVLEPPVVEPPGVEPAVVPPVAVPGGVPPVVLPEPACEPPPPQATSQKATPATITVRQRLRARGAGVKQSPTIPKAATAKVQPRAPGGTKAAELALVVIVTVVLPVVLRAAGLKLQAAPFGNPEQANEIGAVRFCPVAVMVNCAEAPALTVATDGFDESESVEASGGTWPGLDN